MAVAERFLPVVLQMTRTRSSILVIRVVALLVAALSGFACKVRVTPGPGRMDERGPETWTVEGKPVAIDKTYFQAYGTHLSFVVEWTCDDCRATKKLTDTEAFELARPVLWEALARGESTRTHVEKVGTGTLETDRLVSAMSYPLSGTREKAEIVVDKLDVLLDWTWTLGGRSYHVFGPGYYFDTDANRLYFTIQWHDPQLCPQFESLTEASATALALPVMREVLRRKLFDTVPRVGHPPELAREKVESIGVTIVCPEPGCASQPGCPYRGFRTSRGIDEIQAAP